MGEEDGTEMIDRHLHAEGGGAHNHDHHDHDHLHDHDHHSVNALDDLRRQLRGSSFRLGNKKERSLAGEEAPYDYQVDVYVEVDQALCNTQGDTAVCPGQNTIDYGKFCLGKV